MTGATPMNTNKTYDTFDTGTIAEIGDGKEMRNLMEDKAPNVDGTVQLTFRHRSLPDEGNHDDDMHEPCCENVLSGIENDDTPMEKSNSPQLQSENDIDCTRKTSLGKSPSPTCDAVLENPDEACEVTDTLQEGYIRLQNDVDNVLEALERFESGWQKSLEESMGKISARIQELKEYISEMAQRELKQWQDINEETVARLRRLRLKSEVLETFKSRWDEMATMSCNTVIISSEMEEDNNM